MAEDLDKLISLTFDEDPEVRKRAALSLAGNDDPAAMFALIELSHDKDPGVREVATKLLDELKKKEPELMSFAEMFSAGAAKKEDSMREVVEPITKIFEKKLGKEKAEQVKEKILPTLEKMQKDKKVKMQEFLSTYLGVLSDLEEVGGGKEEPSKQELEELEALDKAEVELKEVEVEESEEDELERFLNSNLNLPQSYFAQAYEIMLRCEGDEKIMKKEKERLINQAKKEIDLAFRVVRNRFRAIKLTRLSEIKHGMRNVNTSPLRVIAVEKRNYKKGRKEAAFTRVVVDDGESEGVIYLFDGRGEGLKPGMQIKLEHAYAKTFKFSGETVLTHGKKTNIYILI